MERARFSLKRAIVVMANRGEGSEHPVTVKAVEGLLVPGKTAGVYFIKAYRAFATTSKTGGDTMTYELGGQKRNYDEVMAEAKEQLGRADPDAELGPPRGRDVHDRWTELYWSLGNRLPADIAIDGGNVDAVEMLSPVDPPDEEIEPIEPTAQPMRGGQATS